MATDSTSSPESAPDSDQLPPLRLHHLLTWTAISAAYLTWWISWSKTWEPIAEWWILASLPGILGTTLGLACSGFGLWWRRSGLAFPSQPGHGVLLIYVIWFMATLLFEIPIHLSLAGRGGLRELGLPTWTEQLIEWEWYTSSFIAGILYLLLAWLARPARRWQVFFALSAISFANAQLDRVYWATLFKPIEHLEWVGPGLALTIHYILLYMPSLIPGAALLVATVRDRRHGISRHWSHWAGIGAWCSVLPGEIVSAFVNTGWLPNPTPIE